MTGKHLILAFEVALILLIGVIGYLITRKASK
jgi:preprotein translocase subunit Sss1